KQARDIRGGSAALLARGEQASGAARDDSAARREG
ncbi:FMN-binding negative transcriptional regulator, partial [Pseudomonas aeruginosa]